MEKEEQMITDLKLILEQVEELKKQYSHIIRAKEELLYTCIQLSEMREDLSFLLSFMKVLTSRNERRIERRNERRIIYNSFISETELREELREINDKIK